VDLCNAQGRQKKEHEIKKLKSLEVKTLRMGAPKGIKVIHAYDPAIVDYGFWSQCKRSGIYFITLEKANCALIKCGDIEKVFDQNKNKLGENKAWAKSQTAKKQHAHFICIAHNLMRVLSMTLESHEGITDEKSRQRRDMRKSTAGRKARINNRTINPLVARFDRPTQRCLQFIRWLRLSLSKNLSYSQAVHDLRPLMRSYLK